MTVPFFCCELAKITMLTHRPIEHTQECYAKRARSAASRAKARIPQQDLDLKENK